MGNGKRHKKALEGLQRRIHWTKDGLHRDRGLPCGCKLWEKPGYTMPGSQSGRK